MTLDEATTTLREIKPRVDALSPTEELDPADIKAAIAAARTLDMLANDRRVNREANVTIDEWRKWLHAKHLPTNYRP